jgi:hypothetical protein
MHISRYKIGIKSQDDWGLITRRAGIGALSVGVK